MADGIDTRAPSDSTPRREGQVFGEFPGANRDATRHPRARWHERPRSAKIVARRAGSDETLFVVGDDRAQLMGRGLARIDLSYFLLTTIGDFSGTLKGQEAELTGTGDGRLFGFFVLPSGASLAQIDPTTGATQAPVDLPGVADADSAWAFSFWGGDFWFYSADLTSSASRVTRLRTSGDGSLSVVMPDVGGFVIVGAGVSTCAPTRPPM